ncbi:MAG TPA: hypothetical protein VF708_20470 [Pyrinomonadaceae bacterium]
MSHTTMKQHAEPRYHVNLPVRAEWNEKRTGKHVVTEGITEIVGPAEALVHLQQLPAVGTRITISIEGAKGAHVTANAEVLRLVRDIRQPLASLSVVNSKKQWRDVVWEPAATRALQNAEDLSKAA